MIFAPNQKLIVLLPFGNHHAILEVILVVCVVNLTFFGVLYNFSTRSTLEYQLKMATSQKGELTEQNENRE